MRESALEYIFKSWNNLSSKMLYFLMLSIFKHLNIFNPTFLCPCFSKCLYKAEWCSWSLFSEVDLQKLQADGMALALNDICVSSDFKRYECFGSLEIIAGTKIFLNYDHSKMNPLSFKQQDFSNTVHAFIITLLQCNTLMKTSLIKLNFSLVVTQSKCILPSLCYQ